MTHATNTMIPALAGPITRRAFAAPLMACLMGLVLCLPVDRVTSQEKPSSIGQLDALVEQKSFDLAKELGRKLDDEPGNLDLTLPLARLARSLQQAGRLEEAVEFYRRSVDASTRAAASGLDAPRLVLVRLAAGAVMTEVNQLSNAIEVLKPILAQTSGANAGQREMAVTLLLRAGATALAVGAPDIASHAYQLSAEHASASMQATAMLGEAWAMAMDRRDPISAARKLASFIDRYPDHLDASGAARACAECLKQGGRPDDAAAMLADLLHRWPDSESALEVVASHRDLPVDLLPSAVKRWLIDRVENQQTSLLDPQMTVQGLLVASQEKERRVQSPHIWSSLAQHLASIDVTGQHTSDLLVKFSQTGREAEAERLATMVVAPKAQGGVQAGAREAACRWAGRTQRWSMLALASESETPSKGDTSRTIAVERLLAESLMQTGRVEAAAAWWNHLVDVRYASDFSTLLRCAEAETTVGTEIAMAKRRIEAARAAAGKDRFEHSLVDLLDAELSIRQLEFDRARGLLEQVVRTNETDASLRGRAQWLIGETYFLQRDHAEAIEAYRRVEGIDPGGMWISAALIQAGKSFEQLGRTREAAVCYGNLLTRFAETPHAELARRRLAAISPDAGPSVHSSPQPIRR